MPAILSISAVPLRAGALVHAKMSLSTVYLGAAITLNSTILAHVESWQPMGVGTSVTLSTQGKMVEKLQDSFRTSLHRDRTSGWRQKHNHSGWRRRFHPLANLVLLPGNTPRSGAERPDVLFYTP
ncbi:MAG: hypothetical protein U0903_19640 [Planctomycetales bacterium]